MSWRRPFPLVKLPDCQQNWDAVAKEATDLDSRITTFETVEDWHEIGATGEPAFQNSWTNFQASNYQTAAFYKDPFGVVHLKGLIKSGTSSTTLPAFTLPTGYRPPLYIHEVTVANDAIATARIGTDGTVCCFGSNAWFSLDGITFRAA